MRELSEGDETVLHPDWHVGYTGVYICQKSSNYIHLKYVFTERIFYLNKKKCFRIFLTLSSTAEGTGSIPSRGTKIPHVTQHGLKTERYMFFLFLIKERGGVQWTVTERN